MLLNLIFNDEILFLQYTVSYQRHCPFLAKDLAKMKKIVENLLYIGNQKDECHCSKFWFLYEDFSAFWRRSGLNCLEIVVMLIHILSMPFQFLILVVLLLADSVVAG